MTDTEGLKDKVEQLEEELQHLKTLIEEARPILQGFARLNQHFVSLGGDVQDPLGVHQLLARWPRPQ